MGNLNVGRYGVMADAQPSIAKEVEEKLCRRRAAMYIAACGDLRELNHAMLTVSDLKPLEMQAN